MCQFDLEEQIKKYAKEKGEVTIPEIQVKFNLAYKEVSEIVNKLCEEKFMALGDGLGYLVSADSYTIGELLKDDNKDKFSRFSSPDDDSSGNGPGNQNSIAARAEREQKLFAKTLAFCVSKGQITLTDIKIEMKCGYITACKAADWLLTNSYATVAESDNRNFYRSVMTKDQYVKKFGRDFADLYWDVDKDSNDMLKKLSKRLPPPDADSPNAFFNKFCATKHIKPMPKSYLMMFAPGFNLEKLKSTIPYMSVRVTEAISRARNRVSVFAGEWNGDKTFETICMDLLENIIGMDFRWERKDALVEAARQLVAVEYTSQCREACKVHSRVLYELLYGKDEDYDRIKRQIWKY